MQRLIFYIFISFSQSMPANLEAQNESDRKNKELALNYYLDGNYELSIKLLNKYLGSNPNDYQAFLLRGDSYRQLNQNNDALHDYDEAIKINKGLSSLYLTRASIYDSLQRYDDELKDFDKAIEIDPKNFDAFFSRGLYYSIHGQRDKAIEDYTKTINLNPKNAAAYGNRGLIYFENKDFDNALKDLDNAIELGSLDWKFFWRRGTIFTNRKGENDRAILDFDKAIDLIIETIKDGHIPEEQMGGPYYNRGSINMYFDENLGKALEDFDMAISYNSKNAAYFKNRGLVYSKMGDKTKAKEDWRKAIDLNPAYEPELKELLNK